MSNSPDVLWLNTSPSLKDFDRLLLRHLAQHYLTAQWEYQQTLDEASCLEIALVLLHDYLKPFDRPIHLIGHGMSGVVGLLYARRYPERVRSLTLLSVGAHPAIDWQAHYYAQRQLLPCSRYILLAQMVASLFGPQTRSMTRYLVRRLEKDLDESLSLHTLFKHGSIPPDGVAVPLMVCASEDDTVVPPTEFAHWQNWLKPGDRYWQCPSGRHFFHYFHPRLVGNEILDFWQSLDCSPSTTPAFNATHSY
jgi:pimeloyl-ACP methyl ester carboxylesterase